MAILGAFLFAAFFLYLLALTEQPIRQRGLDSPHGERPPVTISDGSAAYGPIDYDG